MRIRAKFQFEQICVNSNLPPYFNAAYFGPLSAARRHHSACTEGETLR